MSTEKSKYAEKYPTAYERGLRQGRTFLRLFGKNWDWQQHQGVIDSHKRVLADPRCVRTEGLEEAIAHHEGILEGGHLAHLEIHNPDRLNR